MRFKFVKKEGIDKLPKTAGVYCFAKIAKTGSSQLLYIGKAVDIRQRVQSHFQRPVFKDRIFIPKTDRIGFIETNSELEALLLESKLIKKHEPRYNVQWKDGKSHLFVFIAKEPFPRVFVAHQLKTTNNKIGSLSFVACIGPFVDSQALKQTLKLLRGVFPFRTCKTLPKKPCLYKELNLCSAPCKIKYQKSNIKNTKQKLKVEYKKNIRSLKAVLQGKKTNVLRGLKKEMALASKKQNFERAREIRDKVFALEKVFANARVLNLNLSKIGLGSRELSYLQGLLGRVEAYDVSNIQGKQATAGLVVFERGLPNKNEYRKFKIRLKDTPDDIAMLKEVLTRRFNHPEWAIPQAILIDGGKAQLGVALNLKSKILNLKSVFLMALAKKRNQLYIEGKKEPVLLKNLPPETANFILRIRDEAHRFAITYHKKLRSKNFLI